MLRAVTPGSGEPRAQERPGRARCQQEPDGGGSAACAFRGLGQVGLLELEAAVSSALRLRQARSEFVEVQGLVILCVFRDRKHRLLEQPWGTQRPGRRRVGPCLLGASGARCPLRRLAFTALCWPAGPGPRLQPAQTAPQSPRACRARTLCSRMSPTLPGAPATLSTDAGRGDRPAARRLGRGPCGYPGGVTCSPARGQRSRHGRGEGSKSGKEQADGRSVGLGTRVDRDHSRKGTRRGSGEPSRARDPGRPRADPGHFHCRKAIMNILKMSTYVTTFYCREIYTT